MGEPVTISTVGGGRFELVRAAALGEKVDLPGMDLDVVALGPGVGLPLADSQPALDTNRRPLWTCWATASVGAIPGDDGDSLDVVVGAVDGDRDLARPPCRRWCSAAQAGDRLDR
jgi:hypothetical protein